MGLFTFRLPPGFRADANLRRAYVTGQDRTPARGRAEVRGDLLIVTREASESGRLHVPWPVPGFGRPYVGTATLAERPQPYDLAVELARGRLNEVKNQAADWCQAGLRVGPELASALDAARISFARAATRQDQPAESATAASETLQHAYSAGRLLAEAYTRQVLARRLEATSRLSTQLAVGLDGPPKTRAWSAAALETFNTARVRCSWRELAPDEGKMRWDGPDAQLRWCRKNRLNVAAGPLIDFRPDGFPDWLWLWQGDFEEIQQQAVEFVTHVIERYRGKVQTWHVVARPASAEVLGLGEEQQIRLAARLIQVARQLDPEALLVADFDGPWAEWLAQGPFQLGPLHLADSLARADLGLGAVGVELALGYSAPGSHLRDVFDVSRLLDLYALVGLPLQVSLAVPSAATPDPRAGAAIRVETDQWPAAPDELSQQATIARLVGLAVAKPYVQAVTWLEPSDAAAHLYPHAGLFRADPAGSAKPALEWLRQFRRTYLG